MSTREFRLFLELPLRNTKVRVPPSASDQNGDQGKVERQC